MARKNNWTYCENTTTNHSLAKNNSNCLEEIFQITCNEGAKKNPFTTEIAINIDDVERYLSKKEKRNSKKTMDMSFGAIKSKTKCFILAEYRLNYTNPNNLSKSELDDKIKNTLDLLGNEINISTFLFIFSPNVKNHANYIIRRLYSNRPNYIALDISDFKSNYFL
jgi:hypothetical protein